MESKSDELLSPEVLEGIQPFSGMPSEMIAGEQIISSGKSLQRVQTPYTTAVAVQQPRSIARVTKNVLEESKLAGSAFYYRWEVKNKKTGRKAIVQGPSIDLTMCIARNYGNCALDIDVEESLSHYLFKGTFIDLETGFTVPRLFRQRKKQNIGGGYGDDRSEDMVFQIGQSKAQRNCIAKATPGWLVDQAIEEARQAEINKIKPENLHIARGKVLDFFATYGITQDRIETKMECKADAWTAENIADLRGMATGLKEGRISPVELFPDVESKEPENDETKGQTQELFQCPHCDHKPFDTERGRKKHITQQHKDKKDVPPPATSTEQEENGGLTSAWAGNKYWFDNIMPWQELLGLPTFNLILSRFDAKGIDEVPVEKRKECWLAMSAEADKMEQ